MDQDYHYVAISSLNYMAGATHELAVNRLLLMTGEATLRKEISLNGGLPFSVFRVDLPVGTGYPVINELPAGDAADLYAFDGRYKFISIKGRIQVIQPSPL